MSQQNQNSISWQAHEFRHYPKNAGWYMALIAIGIMIITFFIIQKDIFAAVSLAIITVLTLFFAKQEPEVITIELNTKGIKFGSLSIPYKQAKHFWLVDNDKHKTINIHTTALLNNMLILQLENQDPEEARDFLASHIPEHTETEETLAQKIMHTFKF